MSKKNEPPRFAVGIDLGTTNSLLAYSPLESEEQKNELLPLPQLVASATIEPRLNLPSFLYLGTVEEQQAGALDLPWASNRDFAAGEFARRHSADLPQRVVSAAKSWLAHTRVDRRQAVLPWGAPDEVPKLSPVEASRRYLEHLAASWNRAFPQAPLSRQKVVLTVPASFDASARDLTREAALQAGLPEDLVLLEEPQSALYAWLHQMGDQWRRHLKVGDTLLVCDIGGGTTDFTLIAPAEEEGALVLKRLAVGNHILVGGDNMDLALAHLTKSAFQEKGVEVDAWQSVALWHSCRAAKEMLLTQSGPEKHPVTVLGRGRRVVGGTISVELEKSAVLEALVEGFFPVCKLEEKPARRMASGFRELGLLYESDTAITRHLAQFLTQHGQEGRPVRPSHVLFNGGVFKAEALQRRLMETLQSWFSSQPPTLLEGAHDLDYAVARGAAYYSSVKQGKGLRIRGGAARAYYVGIETAGLAVPGAERPLRLRCVAPFGMEEGTETDVPGDEIGLVVGEPAQFRFFSSSTRKNDKPGDLLERWNDTEITETDSLQATLPKSEAVQEEFVPVRFHSQITELGVLELWCVSAVSDDRWKLEFSVREQ